MRCPTLSELPFPPLGKTGWPWTEESEHLQDTISGGYSWPLISIVTPSYNQAQFIEETIRSILLQGYPNIEYIIMDGGSKDDSVEIIKKYERWLAYWKSEPDRGQAHAINKGFKFSNGDLLTWINSDDFLLPSSLASFGREWINNQTEILLGDIVFFAPEDKLSYDIVQSNVTATNMIQYWRKGWSWTQPGTFFHRNLWKKIGFLDENLRYVFDREWMCRALIAQARLQYLHKSVAVFRLHLSSKTVGETGKWGDEQLLVTERYRQAIPTLQFKDIQAMQELLNAVFLTSIFFIHSWDGRAARSHLWNAVGIQLSVLANPQFWLLGLRSLCPLTVVRLIRRVWIKVRRTRDGGLNHLVL